MTTKMIDYIANNSVGKRSSSVITALVNQNLPQIGLEKDGEAFEALKGKVEMLMNECYSAHGKGK